ncbi:MAG: hypothetical protein HY343_07215 [Lentisphaerae bacterium]|nr:hypothetical protein [Lentisphaerota bacterium]
MRDDRRAASSWLGRLRRSLALTADERRALYLVLALAVLGLLARYWHLKTRSSAPGVVVPTLGEVGTNAAERKIAPEKHETSRRD